jgi:hypothetical protein
MPAWMWAATASSMVVVSGAGMVGLKIMLDYLECGFFIYI